MKLSLFPFIVPVLMSALSQVALGGDKNPYIIDPLMFFCSTDKTPIETPTAKSVLFEAAFPKEAMCESIGKAVSTAVKEHMVILEEVPDRDPSHFQAFAITNLKRATGDATPLIERLVVSTYGENFAVSTPWTRLVNTARTRALLGASISEFIGRCTLSKVLHDEMDNLSGPASLYTIPVRYHSYETTQLLASLREETAIRRSFEGRVIKDFAPQASQVSLPPQLTSLQGMFGLGGAEANPSENRKIETYKDTTQTSLALSGVSPFGTDVGCETKPVLYRQWVANPELRVGNLSPVSGPIATMSCVQPEVREFSPEVLQDLVNRYDNIARLEAIKAAIIHREIAMGSFSQAEAKPLTACTVVGQDRDSKQATLDLRYTKTQLMAKNLSDIEDLKLQFARRTLRTEAEIMNAKTELVKYSQRSRRATQSIDAERNNEATRTRP